MSRVTTDTAHEVHRLIALGLRTSDVAERLGVSLIIVSQIRQGRYKPLGQEAAPEVPDRATPPIPPDTPELLRIRYMMPLVEAGVTARTAGILERRLGVSTVWQALHCKREELLQAHHIGESAVAEVIAAVTRMVSNVKEDVPKSGVWEKAKSFQPALPRFGDKTPAEVERAWREGRRQRVETTTPGE